MKHLFGLLALASLIAGCPPSLNNDDDDDDTTTTDDDDDTTATDDDDTTAGDDDDDTPTDCVDSWEWIDLSSSLGPDYVGTWYDGWIEPTDEGLTIVDAVGTMHTFTSSQPGYFSGFSGSGRVFWFTGGNTMWGTDNLLAAELWEPWWRVAMGNTAAPPPALADPWQLSIRPDPTGCGEVVESECGSYTPMAVQVNMPGDSGEQYELYLSPGIIAQPAQSAAFWYLSGHVYLDLFCPDLPAMDYAWLFTQVVPDIAIGIR